MGIIRKTKSLQVISDIFENKNEAKSVVDLIEMVSDKMNRTTVYRILDRLEQEGVLHSFNGKDGLKWYAKYQNFNNESHIDIHPHFQCTECKKVECLPTSITIPNFDNRKIDTADFFLVGQCPNCSA